MRLRVSWADDSGFGFARESVMEEYEKLKQMVEQAGDDVMKAIGGNNAAGTRVRKSMQDIRNMAQEIRKKILDLRKAKVEDEKA